MIENVRCTVCSAFADAQVKAGLLLQLIGGTEKKLANGTHLRGDLNVLMVI